MAEAPKSAPPAPPKAPAAPSQTPGGPPTDLGPGYVVERQIGTGSFATVWLATKDQVPVAIKAVDRSRLTKKLRANLDDEIRILESVKHPNLVAFVDAVPRTERIYVVLEFLAGGDLQKYIRSKGRLHEGTAQKWIGHLAAGLAIDDGVAIHICDGIVTNIISARGASANAYFVKNDGNKVEVKPLDLGHQVI